MLLSTERSSKILWQAIIFRSPDNIFSKKRKRQSERKTQNSEKPDPTSHQDINNHQWTASQWDIKESYTSCYSISNLKISLSPILHPTSRWEEARWGQFAFKFFTIQQRYKTGKFRPAEWESRKDQETSYKLSRILCKWHSIQRLP